MISRNLFVELSSALAEVRKHSKGKLTLKRTSSKQVQPKKICQRCCD